MERKKFTQNWEVKNLYFDIYLKKCLQSYETIKDNWIKSKWVTDFDILILGFYSEIFKKTDKISQKLGF